MKYLLIVLLILVILALALVATLSMHVSFGETPDVRANYCATHALLSVDVTLPRETKPLCRLAAELGEEVPRPLSLLPILTARAGGALLGGIREAYLSETRGCTAFR